MIGLLELFKSKKATMSLIILAAASTALFMGKLDGTSYAAVIATVATIYNFCQHAIDKIKANLPNLPDRGSL